MSKRSRQRGRTPAAPRHVSWMVIALGLAAVGVGAWLLTTDASPLRASGAASAATLASYRPADLHALVVSPTDANTVTFGHHYGMLVSHDGGKTWTALSGADGKDAMGVAIPPNSKTAFAAGHDVFMRSDDGGQSWRSVRPALPGTDIHGFTASATQPGTFFAYIVGFGLFKSSDGGSSWSPVAEAPGSTMSMAAAKSSSGDVLFASTMEGLARSRDGGKSWESVRDVPNGYVSAVDTTVYVADRGTVMSSTDGGLTWQRRSFPRNAGLVAVAPSDPSVVYVVTDQREVWRSANGGATWEHVG